MTLIKSRLPCDSVFTRASLLLTIVFLFFILSRLVMVDYRSFFAGTLVLGLLFESISICLPEERVIMNRNDDHNSRMPVALD